MTQPPTTPDPTSGATTHGSPAVEQMLAAATRGRAPGVAHRLGATSGDPLAAMWRTAQELYGLLALLDDTAWERPTTTEYGRVKDVVAHLVAIEEYIAAVMGGTVPDDPTAHAHVLLGGDRIAAFADAPGAAVATAWFDAVADSTALLAGIDPAGSVTLHGLTIDRELALVFRTFELWAHTEDIAAAIGAPLPRLDGERIGLMASRLVGVLPLFFTEPDPAQLGRRVRLVLLGPGGGVADLALDPAVDLGDGRPADARLVADAVDFCRVASRRLAVGALDHQRSGATGLLDAVLDATVAFALD